MDLGPHVLDFLACSGATPTPWPDGGYLPSVPYQVKNVSTLAAATTPSGSFDAASIFLPDGHATFEVQCTTFPVEGSRDWASVNIVSNGYLEQVIGQASAYRLIGAKCCVRYIGPTLNDSGMLSVQMIAPPWVELGQALDNGNWTGVGPPTGLDSNCSVFYLGALRDGVELIVPPLDLMSRTYRAITDVNGDGGFHTDYPNTADLIETLQAKQNVQWPLVVINLIGGYGG